MHQNAEELLKLLVQALNCRLLHWPPLGAESVSDADQSCKLCHHHILEFRSAITPQDQRQSARSENAPAKHPPRFTKGQLFAWLEQGAVAEQAEVGQHIDVAIVVRGIGWAFAIDHHFLPGLLSAGLNGDHVRLLWSFAEADASDAPAGPLLHIVEGILPIGKAGQQLEGLHLVAMSAENADMDLQEHPPLPTHVGSSLSSRDHWHKQIRQGRLTFDLFFKQTIFASPIPFSTRSPTGVLQHRRKFGVRFLS